MQEAVLSKSVIYILEKRIPVSRIYAKDGAVKAIIHDRVTKT